MRYVSTDEMRQIDLATIEAAFPFPEIPRADALMKLASLGLSNFVLRMCAAEGQKPPVHIVFGPGNNGADAVYAGLELSAHGFIVRYYAAFDRSKLRGSLAALDAAGKMPAASWPSDDNTSWIRMPAAAIEPGSIVIDGILGIGSHGAPSGIPKDAIEWINKLYDRVRIIAVDIPSGVNGDTGDCPGVAVTANYTVCMGMPKRGMRTASSLSHTGSVYMADLEIVPATLAGSEGNSADEMVAERDVAESIPCRKWDAHKGDFGHVCIVGGAMGFCGAPSLAALGALRAGAGLVSALVPRAVVDVVATRAPEMMVWPVDGWDAIRTASLNFKGKIVVAGPGMGRSLEVGKAVRWLLEESGAAGFVLDADALNAFECDAKSIKGSGRKIILTPHPGEAARLLGAELSTVVADREGSLKKLVELTGAAVILKGAGTLISAPGRGAHLVPCVNPGMATGGMGDVLAGIAGAMLGRGLSAFDAARAAAWIHSCAGDAAAFRLGYDAMLATDVAAAIRVRHHPA